MRIILLLFYLLFSQSIFAHEITRAISLINLISDPKKYEGMKVQVYGYLGGLNLGLYLTKAHEEMGDTLSSVDVANLDMKDTAISEYCGGHYAEVTGRFMQRNDAPPKHTNLIFFYIIDDLQRILIFDDDFKIRECWPKYEPN